MLAFPHADLAPLNGVAVAWAVCGGWAIDLHLDRATRPHNDLDICLWRDNQRELFRHLAGGNWEKINPGTMQPERWLPDEDLVLPVHELRWRSEQLFLEFLLLEREHGEFVFRRDPRVRLPAGETFLTHPSGIAYLNPAIVLLFKCRQPRPRDELDFAQARPSLTAGQTRWLRDALTLTAPGHGWLDALA